MSLPAGGGRVLKSFAKQYDEIILACKQSWNKCVMLDDSDNSYLELSSNTDARFAIFNMR